MIDGCLRYAAWIDSEQLCCHSRQIKKNSAVHSDNGSEIKLLQNHQIYGMESIFIQCAGFNPVPICDTFICICMFIIAPFGMIGAGTAV